MSEESELSEPENLFNQDHYDWVMEGQKPWLEFRQAWEGEGDPWEAFREENRNESAIIIEALGAWSARGIDASLDGADFRLAYLVGVRLASAHLRGADLSGAYLQNANLQQAHLERAILREAHLDRVDIQSGYLQGATLTNAKLGGALLHGVRMQGAVLRGADLTGAYLDNKANLTDTDFTGAILTGAVLKAAQLSGATLRGAQLDGANLEGANLNAADLCGAKLDGARLGNTTWARTQISNDTTLYPLYFSPDHFSLNDGSDSIVLEDRDRRLNWGTIRRLGSLPLFGVSYAALSVSLLTITGIGFLNQTRVVEWFAYPIPLPSRILWLLLSSSALAVGSTLYRVKCPERVQVFSETEWVEAHGRARLLYIGEKIKRPWQRFTDTLLWLGAGTGALLLLERVIEALFYVAEDLLGLV